MCVPLRYILLYRYLGSQMSILGSDVTSKVTAFQLESWKSTKKKVFVLLLSKVEPFIHLFNQS